MADVAGPDIQTWATVAQAIGSVLAIWAAGRVVVLQQRLAKIDRLDALIGIAGFTVDQLERAAKVVRDAGEDPTALITAPLEQLADAEGMLAAVPAHDLGSSRMVELLAELRHLVREARPEISKAQQMVKIIGDVSSYWEPLHSREQNAIGVLAEMGRIRNVADDRRKRWWLW